MDTEPRTPEPTDDGPAADAQPADTGPAADTEPDAGQATQATAARPAPNRRQFVKGASVLAGLGVLAAAGGAAVLRSSGGEPAGGDPATSGAPSPLNELANAISPGGPGKDGIPAIDEPKFVTADAADFLADDEPVFGLDHRGDVRAYPQQVLVWHEIVNDTVGGDPVVVTYCPLTGTVIGFTGLEDGPGLTFGTTGSLVNSNLLMYDRETDSRWPQLLGIAIIGKHKEHRLSTMPLVWTTWGAWRGQHPDTQVLSTDTGFARNYGNDPYGSYRDRSGYYVEDRTLFSVMHESDRFGKKDVVIGVRAGEAAVAVHKDLVRRERSVPVTVGGTKLTVQWDAALDTARVVDDGGKAVAFALDAMWFAWYAFYPHTEVVG